MCGILGSVGFKVDMREPLNQITHRGPDDYGEYFDKKNHLYLGHRRLSIIDLSEAGRQPMCLGDASICLTYNGEVYNFQNIREEYFSNVKFKSKTDSEVILHLYKKFKYKTPEFLRGMFAFGIYDSNSKEIFLCRDRLGIKPLYYYYNQGKFAFSSELNALKSLPEINLELDPIGLDYYFNYGYIPAPFSAYKYVRKLKPAQRLIYNVAHREISTIEPYWRLRNAINSQLYSSETEWLTAIEHKIEEAVKIRLISDVPLGAFLSGGLDSSLVVSLMARLLDKPVKTFTIGFDYQKYDERVYAKSVADKYSTEHHVEVVKPDALDVLPKLVDSFGEPFNDSSAIPTYYVAQMARKHVTVALSGDGGDEVFAGYIRYQRMHKYAYLNGVPIQLRKIVQYFGKYLPKHLPGYGILQRQGYENLRLFKEMNCSFSAADQNGLYTDDFKNALQSDEYDFYQRIVDEQDGFENTLITQLQLVDLNSYLPEDILTKVDRMSMLHSLETRVPLLDHELIELALSCPASIRFKNKNLKYIIKSILSDKVSSDVLEHKKQGFGVPLSFWFRNELKNFMQSLIEETKSDSFLNYGFVNQMFNLHQKGGRDFSKHLYSILMYNYWQNLDNR